MLHLQKHLGGPFRHQWLLSFNRFATTAASTASPDPAPFAIEDYLVATCGLSRDKAVKASKQLSHLKSPSKPDAVLAFLSGLGLPPSDIATTVARQPSLLCSKVEKTPHSARHCSSGPWHLYLSYRPMMDPAFSLPDLANTLPDPANASTLQPPCPRWGIQRPNQPHDDRAGSIRAATLATAWRRSCHVAAT
ncbi:hypothetical protein EJB05_45592, partial [Eragrostis curvula]